MANRIILAPISANKLQEPCLNLAAILDILCDRWSNISWAQAFFKMSSDWSKFVTWREGLYAIFHFESKLHDFVQSNSVNIPSIWNYGSIWRDSKSANSYR